MDPDDYPDDPDDPQDDDPSAPILWGSDR